MVEIYDSMREKHFEELTESVACAPEPIISDFQEEKVCVELNTAHFTLIAEQIFILSKYLFWGI